MACSHSADTTGSVRGIAWTARDAAAASDTADEVALKRAAIPNRVIDGDSDAPHPVASAARAHPTLPLGRSRAPPRRAKAAEAARERSEAAMGRVGSWPLGVLEGSGAK